jgi:hypothetical protein
MRRALPLLLAACAPAVAPQDAGPEVETPLAGAHSHNDEVRDRPLEEALALRFASIEVDVLVWEGELVAAHDIFSIAGNFEAMYLEPLQARVDERGGSVYGDGTPLVLWIDLKSGDPIVRDAVHEALARYPMITRFGATTDERAVRVILTGDEASKAAYLEEHDTRLACRDSNVLRDDDPPVDDRFCAYALDFEEHVGDPWDVAAIAAVVEAAGERPLRLWGAPDTADSWIAQREAGVTWVGTDDLAGLAATY